MVNPEKRLHLLYRVEGGRLRTMQSAREGGPVVVSGGVFTGNRMQTPWLHKCSAETV